MPLLGAEALSVARLEAITRRYLGKPYRLDPLGEAQPPDSDPIYRRDVVDCQTFVEQTMAEALAPTEEWVRPLVVLLRYHDGEVRFDRRRHYCLPEWLDGGWPVRDVTPAIGGRHTRPLQGIIRRDRFLLRRGCPEPVAQQYGPLVVRMRYLPSEQVGGLEGLLPAGTIAVLILRARQGFAGHMGWLFRRGKRAILRHASQRHGRVVDEGLVRYLASTRRFRGIVLLAPDLGRWSAGG